MTSIGVIGAGLMGTALTRRLLGAGFEVHAHDVDAAKLDALVQLGARKADSIAGVAEHCNTVVLAVFNTDQVEQVIEGADGILAHARGRLPSEALSPQHSVLSTRPPVVICTSTCDPDRVAALAARVGESVRFLEVPMSGTSREVGNGTGVGLVGGERALMDEYAAVLDAICPRRYYLGHAGSGSRAKLAVNLILGLNRAAIAEGIVFAQALGLDGGAFLDVARGTAAYSQVMDIKGPLMAQREFSKPLSRVDQSLKDFQLMLEQAAACGQVLPFATVYVDMLEDCKRHGEAEWDNAAILQAIARQRTIDS